MKFFAVLKNILIYKKARDIDKFELLEDEPIELASRGPNFVAQNTGPDDSGNENQNSETQNNNNESQNTQNKSTNENNNNNGEEKNSHENSENKKGCGNILKPLKKAELKPGKQTKNQKDNEQDSNSDNICKQLSKNVERIKKEFNYPENKDFIIREFKIKNKTDAAVIYVEGMADKEIINNFILRQLMKFNENNNKQGESPEDNSNNENGFTVQYIMDNLLAVNEAIIVKEFDRIIKEVLNGLTAVFVDGGEECIIIETRGYEKRNVDSPQSESVIRGPQEAFTENLRTNLTLIRKILRNKNLITEMLPLGKVDNRSCAVVYINGITNPKIVDEVKKRINNIDVDYLAGDGELCQFIEDHPYSLFPQILSTERPDRIGALLMEGNVVFITDGSPYASAVPITFNHLFHTSEDMSLRWQFGTFLRIIRLIATFLAVFLPGMYLSLVLYHQEMIPTELLFSIAAARENLPFPTILELILMEISFELIREASLRIPGAIGQTLGIIGAVVLGQAAVSAGIVSPVLIIIVAISGMGSFAIPNFSLAFGMRIIRFVFIFCAAIAGFYGMIAGLFITGGMICSMKSFGVPYLSPVAPKTQKGQDIIVRAPIWTQTARPDFLNPLRRNRSHESKGWDYKPKWRGDQ